MITIVIPAAGEGLRFQEAGYAKPKPLIDVCGKPMIARVMENLATKEPQRIVLVARKEHELDKEIHCNIVGLDHTTEGAVCTILEARQYITEDPLLIANCDQLVFFDLDHFIEKANDVDASIVTFNSTNPHHSYVKLEGDFVTQIAEKVVISDNAVAGIYYFKRGTDFLKYADEMIQINLRYKNEFYVSPLFSLLIRDGKKITAYEVDVHSKHMLGTPPELNIFLDKVKQGRVKL